LIGRYLKPIGKCIPLPVETVCQKLPREMFCIDLVFGQDINQALIRRFRLSTRKGVAVVYADPKGVSGKIGIWSGDVIRQINQVNIGNERDFNNAIVEEGKRSSVLLLVQR
jgi:S1-C subfamily serine protease